MKDKERARGFSPLGLWRGTEDAEKSITEGLPFLEMEAVRIEGLDRRILLASALGFMTLIALPNEKILPHLNILRIELHII